MGFSRRRRKVAVGIPARDEEGLIRACLERLAAQRPDDRIAEMTCAVVANNCGDETVQAALQMKAAWGDRLSVVAVELPPERANAGWARRLALDTAAEALSAPSDLLLSTDADTLVAHDWVSRTLDHFDAGFDAVAGHAGLIPEDLWALPKRHRERLQLITIYQAAIDELKSGSGFDEPAPRHCYEGGASIAVTHAIYRQIGGAPTPPVGEDKALFEAVRRVGGRVRHPLDVRVRTSARLIGRAPGGASDTLAKWGAQSDAEPIWELKGLDGGEICFAGLHDEVRRAEAAVAAFRAACDARDRDDSYRLAG